LRPAAEVQCDTGDDQGNKREAQRDTGFQIVALLQGELPSLVGSLLTVGLVVKLCPASFALVVIKLTRLKPLSKVDFSDLLELLPIALPDMNAFCH
jgi:hypothetical protein